MLFFSCEENRFEWLEHNILDFYVEFFKQALMGSEELDELVDDRFIKPVQKLKNWIECSFTARGVQAKLLKPAYRQKPGAGRRGQHHYNMLMLFLSIRMDKNRITPRYPLIANTMKSCFPEDFEPSFDCEHVRQTCRRTIKKTEQIREIKAFKRRLRDFKKKTYQGPAGGPRVEV